MKNDGTFGAIDNLTITYDGNQLVKVTDAAEALNYNGALDFHDGDDSTCEYDYDNNGALTRDSNRGINSITYDYGHHPSYINMNMTSGPKNITNDYIPDGRKLLSRHAISIPTKARGYIKKTTPDMYVDGLMLRGDTTLMWRFDGGYVELNANGTPTRWNYYVTDHLGSTRMVVDSNDSIRETINYYPFGSEMQMVNPALLTGGTSHPYRFTGKELDRMNSLNMYDFGARLFDVAGVPMWTSVDPLCEKYYHITPYSYCAGNPVMLVDPDGRDYGVSFNSEDKTITISATYYATSDSYESAQSSVDLINAQSGKFKYEMDGVEYAVNFCLKAVDIKSNSIGDLNMVKAMDDTGEANTYLVVPDNDRRLDENTNGKTMGGQDIFVKSSRSGLDTGGHEIGHTLGMTHNKSGLMTADSLNKKRNKEFNQHDINDMITYPLKGMTNSDAGRGFIKNK